ncbi:protein FAR1-RELATED SEQUENCE 5-like isoform X5 [Macadamia integrifolia]|uniref:protein FAR1-RELATED SEQUENCE 5-like isoform X5 n=1 Tax=Macadamia integrifolia TaxID=60698 RepID=UPI001C4FAA70|nr:protein FAR1-RELATED SEQUENCE 5-like isoform X5 [Macadamia integrifolia]
MKRGKKKKKKKPNNEPAILSFYIFVNFGEYTCDGDRMIEDPVRMESDGDMDTKIIENALVQVTGGGDDGELIEIPDGLKLVKHADVLDENIDPYIGMEFESEEAAMIYYDAYARRVGFIIRVGNCHRSGRDGSVISRRFLCNKEGFRVNNKKTKCIEVRKPRAITREGCKAMIMVRKEKSGKWVVTKLETEHSHPLGIPAGKGRQGTIQARPQDEKDKKIRELTTELHRANQKLAECREQLEMVLKDIEIHTNHLTKSVHDIVENVKEIESEDHDYAYHPYH